MIKIDIRVLKTIEKIRMFVEKEEEWSKNFPLDSVQTLIEVTIGESFWRCLSDNPGDAFLKTPELYIKCFKHALETDDRESCKQLLDLFEYNYRSLVTALSDEERFFREKPYRKMIIDEGSAYAQLQYRLHKERQKSLPENKVGLTVGKGAVYTCAFGDEELYQPYDVGSQIDYICFTDVEKKWGTRSGSWQFRKLENPDGLEEEMIKTKYRILAHEMLPEYDYSVWVESSFRITGEIQHFCDVYGENNSFLGFPQSSEDCMYQDVSYTTMGTDEVNIEMRKLMFHYKKAGYPEHNGLIDSRVMVRNHRDPKLKKVMEEWWEETKKFGEIQKNCFNYVAWKNQYPFSICDLFIYFNTFFANAEIDLDPHEEI